mmetsp:Transcript_10765/g.32372  ORF Transcript_10765/g.32372 Transcript_10765/m.32372 type:complete len:98 (-) Transcript_10765:26-319(-)
MGARGGAGVSACTVALWGTVPPSAPPSSANRSSRSCRSGSLQMYTPATTLTTDVTKYSPMSVLRRRSGMRVRDKYDSIVLSLVDRRSAVWRVRHHVC